MSAFTVKVLDSLKAMDPNQWNSISGIHNPFTRFEFLQALESQDCTTAAQGWHPHHLTFLDQSGAIAGLLPAYLKDHSMGEYVFDWGWADAYERHGLFYYPKLLCAVPFTPSVGPRLLHSRDLDESAVATLYSETAAALTTATQSQGGSSWHLLFPDDACFRRLSRADNVLARLSCQFRWHNRDYVTFEDFTGSLVSRKRKMIRKERLAVADQGIRFRHLTGSQIGEADLETFFIFYQATYLKRGQAPYLTRAFFRQIRETMPEQMHLVMAEHGGRDVAAALFFYNDETLFGRYWGCLEEYDRLHFETCYYQGIELCIGRGLTEFDAGAQGEHKILRGFEPTITRSCHWIAHPAFRAAIAEFVEAEARQVQTYAQEAAALLPYRQAVPSSGGAASGST